MANAVPASKSSPSTDGSLYLGLAAGLVFAGFPIALDVLHAR